MLRKEWILLLLLACINFTHIMDFMIMMPLGTYLMPLFDINPQQFSLIVSAYTFSAGAVGFTAAFFVDRFDRKKVLLTGYIGFVIGTFACAFAPSYELLVAARILAGAFGGLIGAQVLSIVGDSIPFERRARAMGIMMAAFSFASAIGVPTGLFLAKHFGWHAPFLVIGSLGLIIIPLVHFFVPKMRSHIVDASERPAAFSVISNILKDKNQQRALLLMVTLIVGHFSIIPFIAPYMEFNVGFTKDQVTLIYFVGGLVTMFTGPLIGIMADKYGKLKVFTIFALLAIIPVFLMTNMPRVPYYLVLIVTAFFFIFAGGRMIPAQAMITSVVLPKQRGGFMSINSSLQQIATGFAALFAGLIIHKSGNGELQNYDYVGYIGIALTIACIFLARRVKAIN
ncbi:MAG: MFS transporter [Bacteroidota bacterium]|nr:MFS transporter [Bacteroidota bacterium]